MHLIKPSYEILTNIDADQILKSIELAGRTCYKSEEKITSTSAPKFCNMLLKRGHESVIEHASLSVRFVVDRGVSHELVRHRLCSFNQESTRYCDYGDSGVVFVIPPWVTSIPATTYSESVERGLPFGRVPGNEQDWFLHMLAAARTYKRLRENGWSPQQARSVLPNSLKTEIVVTANIREWRHILKLRTAKAAHPQMREVMVPLLADLQRRIPVLFDDILADGQDGE